MSEPLTKFKNASLIDGLRKAFSFFCHSLRLEISLDQQLSCRSEAPKFIYGGICVEVDES